MSALCHETSWTIIFNSEKDVWGLYYNAKKDILRTDVPIQITDTTTREFYYVF
jgi:hypothetical protein